MGKNQMYAFKDKQGNVFQNRDEIVTVAEGFYKDLYSSRDIQDNAERERLSVAIDISPVPTEVRETSKELKGGKAPGKDQITENLLKGGGEVFENDGKLVYAVSNDCKSTGVLEERELHPIP